MKGRQLLIGGGIAVLCSTTAAAQAPPPPVPLARIDTGGSLGWFSAKEAATPDDDDWYSRSAMGSVFAGWYWTDHLKTEIEAGGSTEASLYGGATRTEGTQVGYESWRNEYATKRVALSQHYQFFRNAWFHPFLGGGLDLTWVKSRGEGYVYYPFAPGSVRPTEERYVIPESTELHVQPFALVGYKAYFNSSVFFRNDLRLTVRDGINEVALRFGIGVDIAPGRRQ
jgi:hypothetical protein